MTEGLRSIRPLSRESLRGVEPARVGAKLPKVEWVDPCSLYVEESYQRDVTANGVALIRKIYAGFSWARMKFPVCVRLPDSGNALVCIDGQHTATACASHPGISKIPVVVVSAEDVAARASAFVGHNKDRLALTQMAVFYAELAAGDDTARLIDRACRAAGAKILNKAINLRAEQSPGTTIAVGTIRAIAKRHGEAFLARVLRVLVDAERGPMKADEIAAVAMILAAGDDVKDVDRRLRDVIASKSAEQWAAIGSGEIAVLWRKRHKRRFYEPFLRLTTEKRGKAGQLGLKCRKQLFSTVDAVAAGLCLLPYRGEAAHGSEAEQLALKRYVFDGPRHRCWGGCIRV